jgi:hypothetical protein
MLRSSDIDSSARGCLNLVEVERTKIDFQWSRWNDTLHCNTAVYLANAGLLDQLISLDKSQYSNSGIF